MNIRFLVLSLSLLQTLNLSTESVFAVDIKEQEASDQVEDFSQKTCLICYDEIVGEPINLHGHGSPGCKACLEDALEVAYNNRGAQRFDKMKCPQNSCTHTLTLDDIKLIVGEDDLIEKYKTAFEACSKPIQNNNNFSPDEAKMLASLGAKKCPNCSKFVQKNGGCLHLDCACGFKFCWICEDNYKQSGCTPGECKRMPDVTLIEAVKKNDDALVEQLLTKGFDPNQIDEHLKTPLLYATQNKNKEIVGSLLNRADAQGNRVVHVNQPDNNGRTPFEYAVYNGAQEIVRKFIELRNADNSLVVDVLQKNALGATLLDVAQVSRNQSVYKALVENGAQHGPRLFTQRVSSVYLTETTALIFLMSCKVIGWVIFSLGTVKDPLLNGVLYFVIGEIIPLLLLSQEARGIYHGAQFNANIQNVLITFMRYILPLCTLVVTLMHIIYGVHNQYENVYYNGRPVVMRTPEALYQYYFRLLFG